MANPVDRRRSARVEVLGRIQGQVVSLDVPVLVREISLGGMSVETPEAFPVGSVNVFMLTLGDGAGIDVAGRVVYSRPSSDAHRRFYVSGVQFIDQTDSSSETPVGGLVTRIK